MSGRNELDHSFITAMQNELDENRDRKGDWRDWQPTHAEALEEMAHHVRKLTVAVEQAAPFAGSTREQRARIIEHTADVANIAMMIFARFGAEDVQP